MAALVSLGPSVVVAVVALVLLFLVAIILIVRTAKSNMSVRITWKGIEVRRGPTDREVEAKYRRLKSVDTPDSEISSTKRSR